MFRLNGAAQESAVAPFDLADRGLTLGDGLFETIAVFAGEPAALGAHLDRLCAAAAEIRLPVDRARLEAEVLAVAGEGDAVLRLTVTRGAGARGLAIPEDATPTVVVSRAPFPHAALGADVRLATVGVRRNPTSFVSRAKTLSYLDSVLAHDEARRAGADDALMLNTEGRVASTSMANLFVVIGHEVVTPPVSEGVLPGIVRSMVLEACGELGLKAIERPIERTEIDRAESVFATNSVRLVTPVAAIDRRETPDRSGSTARIAAAVRSACGCPASVSRL